VKSSARSVDDPEPKKRNKRACKISNKRRMQRTFESESGIRVDAPHTSNTFILAELRVITEHVCHCTNRQFSDRASPIRVTKKRKTVLTVKSAYDFEDIFAQKHMNGTDWTTRPDKQ